ncbi:hypothetical protein Csp2054_12805 [Curtobacterium sp. 'Ferrero']|uniref:hypothetical protein n=1 Tax=Curtobacterium sp. 'Ferrero' TaxID=2033654 RepID=UPI000BDB6BC8|nr:hypothetical protein [Curtobacterium sp. 'Ferrero']PCN47331.1 hypothetical protein Csp2054_12805 [Curtobacterium sp. 'Ferrero']
MRNSVLLSAALAAGCLAAVIVPSLAEAETPATTPVAASSAVSAAAPTLTAGRTYTPGVPLTIAGTATPAATIDIVIPGAGIRTSTKADAAGRFTTTLSRTFQTGSYAGNTVRDGATGATLGFDIAPSSGSVAPVPGQRPVISSSTSYRPGIPLTIAGRATPGATLDVFVPGAGIRGSVVVAADGSFSYTMPRTFQIGSFHSNTVTDRASGAATSFEIVPAA